jgi:hypothetical protein
MHKVKIGAKNEYEWLNNFKVLQTAFDRNRIDKVCDSDPVTNPSGQPH